ncbi:AAA family ATPase [Dolichospermum sp. UHCC 0684]|uniref:AAA family ATPase n=1 Tax=unclassified Dolichospermum TaxID=2622029 RepID=UPI0014468382|nr:MULTISPECIES: AAA family ATPase [unclassified Dolichospermum]MEA5530755.1 AAA family ATPase [Dolichospermum sp. UHCC 0684]MTJ34413.1 AAA family ATPase [Dolichospermum sp. UHCC 0260]
MHIQKVIIKNFRCFEHLEVNLDPDINIFVGNNGSGKSALLDGIAAALSVSYVNPDIIYQTRENPLISWELKYNPKDIKSFSFAANLIFINQDFPAKKYNDKIESLNDDEIEKATEFTVLNTDFLECKIVYKKNLDHPEYIDVSSRFTWPIKHTSNNLTNKPKSELSVIAYYQGDRNIKNINNIDVISNQSFNRLDGFKNCLNASSNFTDLANWFFVREYEELREGKRQGNINFELPDLKQIRNAISTIIAPNARIYFSGATSAKLMVEWTMETGEKRELLLSQLSAGYRNMLALVMDFARRLAQANPDMENPLAAEAILMIDELDLHLHPTWQQKIIPDLKKVFPNTQIIATTHSPEVVTTVQQNQVKILEDYQIKECPSPTKGMKSSDIVRYVLGLSDLRPDTEESKTLTRLFEAIDNGQLEEAKRLRKELQDWESFDPDMTRADMQIRRLERRNAV